jgi:sec-independent protein translocase protein TatB
MFDIGFLELLIVGLVALLVVGPERLPGVARSAGKWIGKGRRMIAAVKLEIDKEIKAEELKEILAEQKKKMDVQEYLLEEEAKEPADGSNDRNP